MQRRTKAPLSGFPLFSSNDLDETRETVARVFCPHRLHTIGKQPIKALHNHVRGASISLNYLEYGAKTQIIPGELESFYLLQIPISGGASIVNGVHQYGSTASSAAILNPTGKVSMIWEAGTTQILVQICRKALNAQLKSLIGAHSSQNLAFSGPVNLSSVPGAMLRRYVINLISEIDAGHTRLGGTALMSRQIEQTLMAGLLDAASHSHSALLGRANNSSPVPRHLKLAEDYIEAHLQSDITLSEIASAAGSTGRAVQLAFQRYRNTTPMRFWRDRRLSKAHQELLAAPPECGVTDIAIKWGFSHLGRFSQIYRQKFGRSPSETLRGAKDAGWES